MIAFGRIPDRPSEFSTTMIIGAMARIGIVCEAMSHGIPVLAARVGALTNLVVPEQTGLLFDLGDVAGLAAAMQRIWNDPPLARRLGATARAHVESAFNAGVHMDRLRSAYDRAARSGVRPRR